MNSVKISAVSYLNTYPFVYGIRESGRLNHYLLDLDVPSACARKLASGEADIALVPVGALPGLGDYRIVAPWCIGAEGPVRTVMLYSDVPLSEISAIGLDPDSRTSVELVRVLARHHWKISPGWIPLMAGNEPGESPVRARVAIGDKTFAMDSRYAFRYDLAEAWLELTGLPFVFAVWISRKPLPAETEAAFAEALAYGVHRIPETLDYFRSSLPGCGDCASYLQENISYPFDERKKAGMKRFLDYLLTG